MANCRLLAHGRGRSYQMKWRRASPVGLVVENYAGPRLAGGKVRALENGAIGRLNITDARRGQ
jgi:hypothetical protein